MRSFYLACFFLVLAFTWAQTGEEPVLTLNTENFDSVFAGSNYLVVKFYAPWCKFCKDLAPKFSKAAELASGLGLNIKFGQVDIIKERELSKRHQVQSYPLIKMFFQGKDKVLEYKGERNSESILNWIQKRLLPPSNMLENGEDVNNYLGKNELVGFFYGPADSESFKAYLNVAETIDDMLFLHSHSDDVKKALQIEEDAFILFKDYGKHRQQLNAPFNFKDLEDFIVRYRLPYVVSFGKKIIDFISTQEINTVFLIKNNEAEKFPIEDIFRDLAPQYQKDFLFTVASLDKSYGEDLSKQFDLYKVESPVIGLFSISNDLKYLYSGEVSSQGISKFLEDFLENKLEPHFKSQPIPTDPYETGVRVVVGKTFKDIVYDDNNDVLIEFYAPWCGYCKTFAPKYSSLAKQLEKIQGIVIAKMDIIANEVLGIEVENFPAFRLYPKGKKDNPIHYRGDLKEGALLEFLSEHATVDLGDLVRKKKISDEL